MKSYEELVKKVKDLIRKNKTNKALELLAKEQLSNLDKQLILINSRYSKLKEDQTLGILDDDTAQRTLNKINVDLLLLADKIGKHQEEDTTVAAPPVDKPTKPETPTPTPTIKEISPPTPAKGNSKSKWLIGGIIGIILVAAVGYFMMQQSAKKAEKKKLAKIELAKKKRAQVKQDSLNQIKLQAIETARQDSINRVKNIKMGNTFQGGIIFHIDKTEQHGLIMSKGDQSTQPINWFTKTKGKAFATDTGIYSGKENTKLLVAKFPEENHPAQLCHNFKFGNYDDWYLPSQAELDLLYEYHKTLPREQKLEPKYYWSSTEISSRDVYYRSFHNGKSYTWIKGNKAKVRAIRKF